MTEKNKPRVMFASRFAAVATTVGSSVGLGNIWRFPFEAGQHGGGAFLLCYIVFVFLLGAPLLCSEFCMGRGTRRNVFGAYRALSPDGQWYLAGYLGILSSILILSFYSVVAGWTLEYLVQSIAALFNPDSMPMGHDGFQMMLSGWRPLLWTLLFLMINFAVLIGGVTRGIERMSNVLMPLLFVVLVAFCINSFTLPGFSKGVEFMFKPDFSKLTPGVMLSAMGQAFFSLSLGLGCMMTYASYFSDMTRLPRTAVTTAGLDTLVAILAGVMIFPAVFSFDLSPQAGPTLVFEVLPYVFHQLPGGRIWSVMFFMLLVIAALTSSVSMSEISISFFCDEKHMSRRRATIVSSAIAMAGGVLCALSFGALAHFTIFGKNFFDLFDYVTSNIFLPLGGIVCSVFVGWFVHRKFLRREFRVITPSSRRFLQFLVFSLRWICPVAITLIFLNSTGLI